MRAGKPWLISRAKQPRNSTRSPADKRALPRCHYRVCSSDLISVQSELWGHDSPGVGRAQHSTPWFSSQPTPKSRRAHDRGTSKTCGITESFNSCYSSKLHSMENCVSAIIQVVKGGSRQVGAGDVLSCSCRVCRDGQPSTPHVSDSQGNQLQVSWEKALSCNSFNMK